MTPVPKMLGWFHIANLGRTRDWSQTFDIQHGFEISVFVNFPPPLRPVKRIGGKRAA
jgi:hypothetical protein